jgi:hypothetical protein
MLFNQLSNHDQCNIIMFRGNNTLGYKNAGFSNLDKLPPSRSNIRNNCAPRSGSRVEIYPADSAMQSARTSSSRPSFRAL